MSTEPADEAAEPRYPFVVIETEAERTDELSALLFELGACGVEERDDGTLARGPGTGRIRLIGSFATRDEADEAVRTLADDHELEATIEEVVGDGWRDAYKQHFKPFSLSRRITICPPWEMVEPEAGRALVLDPGRAFGTGLHATTSLVAELLDDAGTELDGARVLDVGTGSGILAFVALALGASEVEAIDNDPDVIDVVRENAERNGMDSLVRASTRPVGQVGERFPWVLANIEAKVLDPLAEAIARTVAPGGHLLLSGLLGPERARLTDRYTSLGLTLVEARERGDAAGEPWVALHLQRPA
jgi:ribosomal protein L11 methyltransferase